MTEHERVFADALSTSDTYRLMTDVIAPRPIAWVSTLGHDGHGNLAPFSYFQGVCSRPPTIVLGIASRPDGTPKDTLRNILATRELTISHVSEPLVTAMNRTSGEYPPGFDEWQLVHDDALTPAASCRVRPPWIGQAKVALECRMTHAIPLGESPHGGPSSTLVVARILCFHVAPGLLQKDARGRLAAIDPAQLASVGRLGGIAYARTNERIELARPKVRP
jgi:flavin reductase (DIM6/NTAB) family NADH-FMN oxidoreductase RutF